MDHIINLIVRFFAFFSRFAPALSRLGFVEYRSCKSAKDDPDLSPALTRALGFIWSHKEQIKEKEGQQIVHYQSTLDEMGEFLVQWMHSYEEAV